MGSYAYYVGDQTVPKDKLPELTQRMMKLLEQGGFMNTETVSLYGRDIQLLSPLKPDKEQCVVFYYNYFQDTEWEPACYDTSTGHLSSNKIFRSFFRDVIEAAYVLLEFYTEEFGITTIDNSLLPEAWRAIGWINYLFDVSYTDSRLNDPWKNHRLLHDTWRGTLQNTDFSLSDEYDIDELGAIRYLTVVHTDDVRKIRNPVDMETFTKERPFYFWPPEILLRHNDYLAQYLKSFATPSLRNAAAYLLNSHWNESHNISEQAELRISIFTLFEMCASSLEKIIAAEQEDKEILFEQIRHILSDHEHNIPSFTDLWFPFWFSSYLLPKETTIKLVSDCFEMDFWELFAALESSVEEKSAEWSVCYGDRCIYLVAPEDKQSTARYLRLNTRGLSDDDPAYYWRPDGDVILSDNMIRWLEALGTELDEIETGTEELINPNEFGQVLIDTLFEANKVFIQMHFFRDAFYKLLSHSNNRIVQATVILMKNMINRNREEFTNAEKDTDWWGYGIGGERHPARLEIKRYFAVLGNPYLRKRWLQIL